MAKKHHTHPHDPLDHHYPSIRRPPSTNCRRGAQPNHHLPPAQPPNTTSHYLAGDPRDDTHHRRALPTHHLPGSGLRPREWPPNHRGTPHHTASSSSNHRCLLTSSRRHHTAPVGCPLLCPDAPPSSSSLPYLPNPPPPQPNAGSSTSMVVPPQSQHPAAAEAPPGSTGHSLAGVPPSLLQPWIWSLRPRIHLLQRSLLLPVDLSTFCIPWCGDAPPRVGGGCQRPSVNEATPWSWAWTTAGGQDSSPSDPARGGAPRQSLCSMEDPPFRSAARYPHKQREEEFHHMAGEKVTHEVQGTGVLHSEFRKMVAIRENQCCCWDALLLLVRPHPAGVFLFRASASALLLNSYVHPAKGYSLLQLL